MSRRLDFLVVGAGFSGAVLARELVSCNPRCRVTVIDERSHTAGNCHTARDVETGVMVHTYGPHIFNTDRLDVWAYVNRHCEMQPFINRVKAVTRGAVFSLPINLHTINQFFGKTLSPSEALAFVESLGDKGIIQPENFEQQALRFLGKELYEAFFKNYTEKQWGCSPALLPASILKRLPVRFDYNDNYYSTAFQGIPKDGYTALVDSILTHERIHVHLSTPLDSVDRKHFAHTFYTGPLDAFFDYEFGRLSYRTVEFERIVTWGDYQGNAVVNYTDSEVPYTRIHEHKHFAPWERHKLTVAFKEFSRETQAGDVPYYPKRLEGDMATVAEYRRKAEAQSKVSFLGRLATYRYLNMDQVIGEALDFSSAVVSAIETGKRLPVFSNSPL